MSILFDEEQQIFHLQTRACSYVMQVLPSGHLSHLYWGAPVRDSNLTHLLILNFNRAFSPFADPQNPGYSLDTAPLEFPTYGSSDFRSPALEVQRSNGSTVSDLRYHAHRITKGKPPLPGLPATYVEADDEADTLEIDLIDEVTGLKVTLCYSAYDAIGALTRSVHLSNTGGESLRVLRCLSANVDFPEAEVEMVQLSGAWARERDIHRRKLSPGIASIESRRGASGHEHNPFFALVTPGTNENQGEAYAFNLVYSGSFLALAEVGHYATTRAQIGLNPFDFSWLLEPGESFQAPEAVLVYSGSGLGEMSRTFHRLYRTRLCRGLWRDKERPILINSWEASYFDIDEEKILRLGRTASELGVELLVMDDGWFGKRDDDSTSLGDWFVHRGKFPDGLEPLARQVNDLGLKFGLWFEPEMISPDSELYRAHPDWCLHVPDRHRTPSRQQLILDLSRADVCEAIVQMVGDILSSVPIGYVKWDMNRNMTEIGSASLPPERQRETAHRYMLGLYGVLEELTKRFPEVLFESCSGGGGRFDPGFLHYMPQAWTSDNTDAITRLRIQFGSSMAYPAVAMGAHVSDSPNHQVGRSTPLATRGAVAMGGNFGYELDINRLSDDERNIIQRQIEIYKEIRPLVQTGDFYRLLSPFESNDAAWMFVSGDKTEAVVFTVRVLSEPNSPFSLLKLRGLDAQRDYVLEEVVQKPTSKPVGKTTLGGDVLMHAGIRPTNLNGDFAAQIWRLTVL